MRTVGAALSLAAAVALGSCDIVASLPLIDAEQPVLTPGNQLNVLRAAITQRGEPLAGGLTVTCQLTLHTGKDRVEVLAPAFAVRAGGPRWTCPITGAQSSRIRPSQLVGVVWRVENQERTPLAESPVLETITGCGTRDNQRRALEAMQAAVIEVAMNGRPVIQPPVGQPQLPPRFTRQQLLKAGYIPTHGATAFAGMGVAFIRADAAGAGIGATITGMNFGAPDPARPDLLLMDGNPTAVNRTDVNGYDEPYTLIGWAFAQTIPGGFATPLPPTGARGPIGRQQDFPRPVMRCIPRHEWFLHAEGIHKDDGSFGLGNDPGHLLPSIPPTGQVALPHRALWDIHFFFSPTGVPEIGITRSTRQPFVLGLPVAAEAFFYPTAYDQ